MDGRLAFCCALAASAAPAAAAAAVVAPPVVRPVPPVAGALPDLSAFGAVLGAPGLPGPAVLSLVAPVAPVAGRLATFTVGASAGGAPVSGLSIDFGERGARFGETACRRPAVARPATFALGYAFATPGVHTVRYELTSGDCSSPSSATAGSLVVTVAPAAASTRQASGPDAAVAVARCPGADLRPRRTTRTRDRLATLCLLDAVRRAAGLRGLRSSRRLRRIAAAHARDMVTRRYFDHTEPPRRTLLARLRAIGWAGVAGENLGYGTLSLSTPRAMMRAWLNSTEHRANVLDPAYRTVGIAISLGTPVGGRGRGGTYTIDFGGS